MFTAWWSMCDSPLLCSPSVAAQCALDCRTQFILQKGIWKDIKPLYVCAWHCCLLIYICDCSHAYSWPVQFSTTIHVSWAPLLSRFECTAGIHTTCWKYRHVATIREIAWICGGRFKKNGTASRVTIWTHFLDFIARRVMFATARQMLFTAYCQILGCQRDKRMFEEISRKKSGIKFKHCI